MKNLGRREFLRNTAASALGVSVFSWANPLASKTDQTKSIGISKRRLGKTDHQVSIISLGGAQPGNQDEEVAIIHRALDLGINYIDTSEGYGGGRSESYIGEVMQSRRKEVFLSTKTQQRTKHGIEDSLFEKSCNRLQTDFIDLYFLHAVDSMNDLNSVLDRDEGAIRAFERLREKGRIGNIGISSHSIEILDVALQKYDFDCILVTVNPAGITGIPAIEQRLDGLYNQNPKRTREFLQKIAEKDVGIIAMKIPARHKIFERDITMEQSLTYALSAGHTGNAFPVSTAVIGISNIEQINENVRFAGRYRPYNAAEMDQMEALAFG